LSLASYFILVLKFRVGEEMRVLTAEQHRLESLSMASLFSQVQNVLVKKLREGSRE
jgi:hypothetical protein